MPPSHIRAKLGGVLARVRSWSGVETAGPTGLVDPVESGKLPNQPGHGLLLLAGFLGVTATGWVDYVTGGDLGLALVYIGIVGYVTWYTQLRWGLFAALLSGLAWTAALVPFAERLPTALVAANSTSRFILFTATALLVNRLHTTQTKLHALNHHLERALHQESSLARTDPMTGLLNRRGFSELGMRELARCQRSKEPLALAYLDLDRFKSLNDAHGHEVGDLCLREVAGSLQASSRITDVVARLGGDEFVLLMPATRSDDARKVCERVLAAINTKLTNFRTESLGASVGLITFSAPPLSVEDMLRQADGAMYVAKHRARGTVHSIPAEAIGSLVTRQS